MSRLEDWGGRRLWDRKRVRRSGPSARRWSCARLQQVLRRAGSSGSTSVRQTEKSRTRREIADHAPCPGHRRPESPYFSPRVNGAEMFRSAHDGNVGPPPHEVEMSDSDSGHPDEALTAELSASSFDAVARLEEKDQCSRSHGSPAFTAAALSITSADAVSRVVSITSGTISTCAEPLRNGSAYRRMLAQMRRRSGAIARSGCATAGTRHRQSAWSKGASRA